MTFLTLSFYFCLRILHLWVLYRRRLFLTHYEFLHILATYCNRSSSWYLTRGDFGQFRFKPQCYKFRIDRARCWTISSASVRSSRRNAICLSYNDQSRQAIMKNVGLRVKCLLRLTDFNQNRNVQTNFNKSLNVNFLVKFSDGRHFFPYSLAGVTKLTISFHVCFSSAPKIFILCFFWLNFNPQSLPSSHVVCLGFYRFFSLQSRVLSSIINLLAPELFF